MRFVALDKLINLYEGYRRVFTVGRTRLLLLQLEGELHLVSADCPHSGADLHYASLYQDRDRPIIRCAQHGMEFDIRNGRNLSQQGACQPLTIYDVAYDGNEVGVWVS